MNQNEPTNLAVTTPDPAKARKRNRRFKVGCGVVVLGLIIFAYLQFVFIPQESLPCGLLDSLQGSPSGCLLVVKDPPDGSTFAKFSADGRLIAFESRSDRVRLWEIQSGRELCAIGEKNQGGMVLSPDATTLAIGAKQIVKLWDVTTGCAESRILSGGEGLMSPDAFSSDGRLLAATNSFEEGPQVKLWDTASGHELKPLPDQPLLGRYGRVNQVRFSPDDKLLASANSGGTVTLWDIASGLAPRTLHADNRLGGEIKSIAFSPDGKLLATGGNDFAVKLWDVESGRELRTFSRVWAVNLEFSPDGKVLAAGANGNTVHLWDLESGREWSIVTGITQLNFLGGGVFVAARFSPDSKMLITSSSDGTIKLWRLK